jgi:xanthine dehydrogenase accessory factor
MVGPKMNENEYLAKIINEHLVAGSPVVLISVMNIQGSSPRHEGTKMAVDADGKVYGTIGGSLIEAAAIKESQKVFSERKSKVISFALNGKDTTAPGMICGGTAEILLDFITQSEENLKFSRQWCDILRQGKIFYMLTHLKGKNTTFQILGHAIFQPDKDIFNGTSFTAENIDKLKKELYTVTRCALLPLDKTQVLVDRISKEKTLFCIGAGHVAVPTAHLAALAGFRVIILDDRPEYVSAKRFPEAHSTKVIEDFNHAFKGFEIDQDAYIVIFTYSHQYDREVLEQAINTSAGYVGMISSKRKRAAIFEALIAKGVKKERLEWVHSPIGLDIGAETPEEIAVSIVAEMIKVRSQSKE